MPSDDTAAVLESDLPLVRRNFPTPFRVLVVAFGAFLIVFPTWEYAHVLWPFNIASPFFLVVIIGAGWFGARLASSGLSRWSDCWSYPEHAIVVTHSAWGQARRTRLSATNVAGVEVRTGEDMDGEPYWQVVVVPKPTFSGLAAAAGRGGVFDAGNFRSQSYAERVRDALVAHLGLRPACGRVSAARPPPAVPASPPA